MCSEHSSAERFRSLYEEKKRKVYFKRGEAPPQVTDGYLVKDSGKNVLPLRILLWNMTTAEKIAQPLINLLTLFPGKG